MMNGMVRLRHSASKGNEDDHFALPAHVKAPDEIDVYGQ